MQKVSSVLEKFPVPEMREPPDPDCAECCDTGWVDAGGGKRRCGCHRRRVAEARLQKIPPKYRGFSLETINPKSKKQEKAVAAMLKEPMACYFLFGPSGTGKTALLVAQAGHMIRRCGRRARLAGTVELERMLRLAEFGERPEWDPMAFMESGGLLAWDDCHVGDPQSRFRHLLFDLVDQAEKRQMLISASSNRDPRGDLAEVLDGGIIGRFVRMCRFFEFTREDRIR